ncbi:MarC family protein [uncultured Shimia sp.]|uniref:MarC family protein n=1 Tax=uncultured Shimia sp. TaxID=573152 RepID=UPI0025FDD0D3|nr:MarC family protein [uncultured Shimia sp.]
MSESFAIAMFGALFAVMNPFINLPVFLGLTEDLHQSEQRSAATKILTYTAVSCVIIAISGTAILTFFGVSVDAFRVAGGMVLVQIGFVMLNGRRSTAHHGTEREREVMQKADADSIAFYPMTFPMLVGPGTITTLILYAQQVKQPSDWAIYSGCVLLVLLMIAVVFYFAGNIGRYLSNTARTIMTRLMGMVLIAIAVGMVADGAKVLLPGLA